MNDDNEPVTREWFASIGIAHNEADTEYETVVNVGDGRTEIWGHDDEEITHLGYSFTDNTAYIDVMLGSVQKETIILGPKTRGEMRMLFKALKTWDGNHTPEELARQDEQRRKAIEEFKSENPRLWADLK